MLQKISFLCVFARKQTSTEVRDIRSDQAAMFMIESRKEKSPSEFKRTEGPFGVDDPCF